MAKRSLHRLGAEAGRDDQQPASRLAVDLVGNRGAMPPARPDEVLETQGIFDWMRYPAALLWKRLLTGSAAGDTWMTTQLMKVMTKGVQPKHGRLQAECSSGRFERYGHGLGPMEDWESRECAGVKKTHSVSSGQVSRHGLRLCV